MPSKTYYPSYIMKGILTHNTLPTIEQRVGNRILYHIVLYTTCCNRLAGKTADIEHAHKKLAKCCILEWPFWSSLLCGLGTQVSVILDVIGPWKAPMGSELNKNAIMSFYINHSYRPMLFMFRKSVCIY
jgi:hypothetical protein